MSDYKWIWVRRIFWASLAGLIGLALLNAELHPIPAQKNAAELCAPYRKFHGHLDAFNKAVAMSDTLACPVYAVTWINAEGLDPDDKAKRLAIGLLERRYPGIPEGCADQLIHDGFLNYILGADETHKATGKLCVDAVTAAVERKQYNAQQQETRRQLEEK
jgi:hypothetical protein